MLFRRLHSYYEKSILLNEKPNQQFYSNYHWFGNESGEWIGIPIDKIDNQELGLLRTLFHYEDSPFQSNPFQKKWYDFLFLDSVELPEDQNFNFRIIQFKISGSDWERQEIEEALHGLIDTNLMILWETNEQGVLVELNPDINKLNEAILASLSQALESDLYIKTYFYYGKTRALSKECVTQFQEERVLFQNVIRLMPTERVFTFEKCFPSLLAAHLSTNIKEFINTQILDYISDDPEMIRTVKRYLENNSNATLTARHLYIHRNTLQYRLDKFIEKTGISLKDFNCAITVYLACLMYVNEGRL